MPGLRLLASPGGCRGRGEVRMQPQAGRGRSQRQRRGGRHGMRRPAGTAGRSRPPRRRLVGQPGRAEPCGKPRPPTRWNLARAGPGGLRAPFSSTCGAGAAGAWPYLAEALSRVCVNNGATAAFHLARVTAETRLLLCVSHRREDECWQVQRECFNMLLFVPPVCTVLARCCRSCQFTIGRIYFI